MQRRLQIIVYGVRPYAHQFSWSARVQQSQPTGSHIWQLDLEMPKSQIYIGDSRVRVFWEGPASRSWFKSLFTMIVIRQRAETHYSLKNVPQSYLLSGRLEHQARCLCSYGSPFSSATNGLQDEDVQSHTVSPLYSHLGNQS